MNTPSEIIDYDEFRNKALIGNLWVILATITTGGILSISFASSGRAELFYGFLVYFISNSLALWAAYRRRNSLALIGYTVQVFFVTTIAMILLNTRPAHMVLAMTNFVLLHSVVLGKRAALIVTCLMVGLLLVATILGEMLLPTISSLIASGQMEFSLSDRTQLISLMVTTFSTGYLIVTTISLQDQSRAAIVEAHKQLAKTKSDLQDRLDKDRYLSELGASVASATSIEELHNAVLENLEAGLSDHKFRFVSISNDVESGIPFGNGPEALLLISSPPLLNDNERFARNAASLFEGAHARMIADQRFRNAERLEGVGRLAASVAHDFNNLLMPISATYEIIESEATLSEEFRTLIGPAMLATKQASALVKKLLVHACSLELIVEPVDLRAVILSTKALLQTFIFGDVILIIDVPKDPVVVLADRIEIEQVLLNLVLNAINAINAIKSSGKIVIALEQKNGSCCTLEIRDDGPGVPVAIRDWVLEPFNTTHAEGSGLGLSTVQRIISGCSGEFSIKTAPEGGACIQIILPMISTSLLRHSHESISYDSVSSLEVLLVEDDPSVSDILYEMLETLGHSCIKVCDGDKALDVLEINSDIDIILTDYQMPILNGAELVRCLRERNDYRPVILISGYGAAMINLDGPKPNKILGKPVRLKQLKDSLVEVMNQDSSDL